MNFESPVIGATNQITFESPSQAWVGVADRNDVVSGAAYSTIKKGTSDYANWLFALGNATASATAAGYAFSMGAILCIHGEQDFLGGLPAATYQGDIVEWQSDMQTDIHNTIGQAGAIPFFVSQISQWWSGYIGTVPTTTGSASGARSVPLGQLDACRANIGVIYCSGPKYQFQYSVSPHFTNAGYLAMGERDGHAVKTVILDHQYWTGVQPRATTISGATIKARYWVQVAPLVIDTALVSNRGTGKGFEYWDDSGSPPPISSVSVSGDTVTITLASTPAGFTQQRLRYAYTAPGDPGMGNGARGNLRDSDTAMGRLSGAHLYNWAMHSDDPIPFIGPGYPLARRTSIGGRASVRGPAIIQ
jgi:hypothetical protein